MKPEEPKQPSSRREFIKKTAIGLAAFTIVPRHVLGGQGFLAPSDKLTKAVIGVGGMVAVSAKWKYACNLPGIHYSK